MNSDENRFLKPAGGRLPASRGFVRAACLLLSGIWLLASATHAATFSGTASIAASDPTGALSADSVNNTLTVSCWFRLSIPSSTNLTENLVILMDRTDGNDSANFSYEVRFNIFNGNIEFLARGANGAITNTLIARPYLDRWYHVAVVRQQSAFAAYVDGRQLALFPSTSIGSAVGGGLSIGGVSGNSRLFQGDIVEVAIYQSPLNTSQIQDRMFKDQRSFANLKGYYKLAYSANTNDLYRNYVSSPPSGTDPATKQGAGNIGFEETDQAGEQSIFDSRKNRGQDAITPLSGAFGWSQTAFARPVPGLAFDFRFGYSSATPTTAPADGSTDPLDPRILGKGWRQTFDTRIAPEQISTERRLIFWDGSIETWNRTNSSYFTRHREYRGELVQLPDFSFEWTTPQRLVYHFQDPTDGSLMAGRLREIRDFNDNKVQIQWNEGEGYITNVVDTAGGSYQFKYNTALGLLTNLSFGQWQVNFAYDATNRLISKTLTNRSSLYTSVPTTWQFQYDTNGLLACIIDPRGNTNTLAQYDQYGRQTNQVDALGRSTATRYGAPGNRQITRVDSGANSWIETYDRKGHILAQQDPLTNTTSYTYDANGNRLTITEPLGWTTSFGYDSRANVTAKTNALGEITRWTFHSFFNKAVQEINPLNWTNFYAYDAGGNLTNHSDALGSLVRYTYATNGLVLTSTDANGNTSQFAYDTNGFLIARTDPAMNTWQFTVNDVGWKLAEINPFNDTTSLGYDLNGNVVQTTDPLNRSFTRQYDANGNLLVQSDGKNQFSRHAYDAANQRIATTNRAGSVWLFTFTSRGKSDRSTDPLGNTTTNFYDAANRLVRVSDPLGNTITNQYDANGNSVALFDTLGQRWSKTFDRLNRVIAETDPLGDSKQTTYDSAGRISQITTPNGFPSLHFYDGRGRLTKWKDAEGFDWLYAYDGNANITNITDALGGHYVMTYGPRNERTLERNQDNFEWQYTYDQLLRLKTQRDPNLTLRTRNYDPAGRVTSHTLSTGREDTYTYDDNDNPRVIVRRVNGVAVATTSLTYDALDRATRVVDPFNQSVGYGFDALSRIVSITYPGNHTLTNHYDPLGRLTNQMDWAARQMSYDYDKAGRLIRRAYPNGVVQTNTFDSAGRLTGLSHSPLNPQPSTINIALTYAYDRNGNKVGNSERGTFAWPMPSLTDETASYTAAGRLINRQVQNTISNQLSTINYAYDSSGNMTNAAGGGQSWRLTYDEDNRTTSILWDAGITSKLITSRYDALGRRIARKVDGVETRYVLDLSGGMERILCDITASGQVTAYYIHGPDLCYRVDASNNMICYHADAQANIISVTDGGGTNVAQYAYTPYGRSLGSSPSTINSQPYTFVGSQGVMEELPGLYFMRARYYSADAGVFLSTDAVKNIGPGWKPVAYAYASSNPFSEIDPRGLDPFSAVAAFGVGLVWDFASQIYKYNSDPNYMPSVSELWISGAKAAVATEAAEDVAIFAAGSGVATLAGISAGALVNGGANVIEQSVHKGIGNIDFGESAEEVFFAGVSGGISKFIPNISMNGKPYWGGIPGPKSGVSHLVNNTVHSVVESATDSGLHSLSTVAGGGGGGSSGNQSMSSRAASAGSYAQSLNNAQASRAASSTSSVSNGGSSGSGGSAFTRVVSSVQQAATSVTQAVRNAATTVGQAITSAVQTVSSWASSAWSFVTGRHP